MDEMIYIDVDEVRAITSRLRSILSEIERGAVALKELEPCEENAEIDFQELFRLIEGARGLTGFCERACFEYEDCDSTAAGAIAGYGAGARR